MHFLTLTYGNDKLHISAVNTWQELLIGREGFSPEKRKNNITCNRKPVGYFNPPLLFLKDGWDSLVYLDPG